MRALYYFDIDDELFSGLKASLNLGINSILDGMVQKNVYQGELTLSVKVALSNELVTDSNGDLKEITVPCITHKAVTKMSVKNENSGKVEGVTSEGFLALTKVKGRYAVVLTPPDASQMTLDAQRRFAGLDGESEEEDDD